MKKFKMDKEEILKKTVNKRKDKTTVSKKFKEDIIDFFNLNPKIPTNLALEIGCYAGYTSRILSFIFDNVIAMDKRDKVLNIAKKFNKDRENIKFIKGNSYTKTGWNFPKADTIFIDCMHDYNYIKSDIKNAIKNNSEGIIIFDDYGLIKSVHKAVDEFIHNGKLKVMKKIGESKGTKFEKTRDKVLKDSEGIICKVINKKE